MIGIMGQSLGRLMVLPCVMILQPGRKTVVRQIAFIEDIDYKMYETMQRMTCYLELFNREGRCLLLVEPLKYMGVEWLWVLCNHQLAVYPGIEFEDSPRPLQIPSSLYAALVTCLSQDEWPGPCTSNHQGETIKPVIDSVEITLDFVILYYEIILFIT